jgi:ATPase family associated with various cellular activities (AAA)
VNGTATTWVDENQRHVMAALARVRGLLQAHADRSPAHESSPQTTPGPETPVEGSREPFALETVVRTFGLSEFEASLLVLCAGVELDATFAALCATAGGDSTRPYPTFGLALAALPGAHWSAITPVAPLRRWRLVDVGSGPSITTNPLRIDERILHFLAGVNHLDERLAGMVRSVPADSDLVPTHRDLADRIVATWSEPRDGAAPVVVQLSGADPATRAAIVAEAGRLVGMAVWSMAAGALPTEPHEVDALARLWEREAALGRSVLLIDRDDQGTPDPTRDRVVGQLVDSIEAPVILGSSERHRCGARPAVAFSVCKPSLPEQRSLWVRLVGHPGLDGALDPLVSQFDLGTRTIRESWDEARPGLRRIGSDAEPGLVVEALWDACREQTRPRLEDLAQRIEAPAGWDDLVLPESQTATLREILVQARNRSTVYDTWRFGARDARGLGISALFVGASGTGKTLAAEVLASKLRLDLYRIDLSQVVSKYIGETEKNLRRVFDAAEEGGGVLLFDEADALFGKRSEVKDSHDRYANIEVGYLLQRMESYRGLAILTTNMKEALDPAFLRRIRFVVHFPFPDRELRMRIWRGVFPSEAPVDGIDLDRLASLNVAGGNIRNMAVNAAFLAADEARPIGMGHLLRAARSEYAKLEKTLTEVEIGGWP